MWIKVEGIEYSGELRAWAVDDDTETSEGGERWAMCRWHRSHGETRIEWSPSGSVWRVADLNDEDGRVFCNVVALAQRDT